MREAFSFAQFKTLYPNEQACIEEIIKLKFPEGIYCVRCNKITRHYKLRHRTTYSCKTCRFQLSPLSGTLFEKSSTPLRTWFLALFIMTHARANISSKQLERELKVTYKTAWKMHTSIKNLMERNNGDLLKGPEVEQYREKKWVFFNKLEIKVVQKQEPSLDEED